jgi:hypothetical protein
MPEDPSMRNEMHRKNSISEPSNSDGNGNGSLPNSPTAIGSLSLPSLTSIYGLPCFNCPDIDRCGIGLPINPVVCEKISLWLLRVRKTSPLAAT